MAYTWPYNFDGTEALNDPEVYKLLISGINERMRAIGCFEFEPENPAGIAVNAANLINPPLYQTFAGFSIFQVLRLDPVVAPKILRHFIGFTVMATDTSGEFDGFTYQHVFNPLESGATYIPAGTVGFSKRTTIPGVGGYTIFYMPGFEPPGSETAITTEDGYMSGGFRLILQEPDFGSVLGMGDDFSMVGIGEECYLTVYVDVFGSTIQTIATVFTKDFKWGAIGLRDMIGLCINLLYKYQNKHHDIDDWSVLDTFSYTGQYLDPTSPYIYYFAEDIRIPILISPFEQLVFQRIKWPWPDGMYRRREKIITDVTSAGTDGERARFYTHYSFRAGIFQFPQAPLTGETPTELPVTPNDQVCLSNQIFDHIDGVWILSEDQSSPVDFIEGYGLPMTGDILGHWTLNELQDMINDLTRTVIPAATEIAWTYVLDGDGNIQYDENEMPIVSGTPNQRAMPYGPADNYQEPFSAEEPLSWPSDTLGTQIFQTVFDPVEPPTGPRVKVPTDFHNVWWVTGATGYTTGTGDNTIRAMDTRYFKKTRVKTVIGGPLQVITPVDFNKTIRFYGEQHSSGLSSGGGEAYSVIASRFNANGSNLDFSFQGIANPGEDNEYEVWELYKLLTTETSSDLVVTSTTKLGDIDSEPTDAPVEDVPDYNPSVYGWYGPTLVAMVDWDFENTGVTFGP